jgi:hypothetical protein
LPTRQFAADAADWRSRVSMPAATTKAGLRRQNPLPSRRINRDKAARRFRESPMKSLLSILLTSACLALGLSSADAQDK